MMTVLIMMTPHVDGQKNTGAKALAPCLIVMQAEDCCGRGGPTGMRDGTGTGVEGLAVDESADFNFLSSDGMTVAHILTAMDLSAIEGEK